MLMRRKRRTGSALVETAVVYPVLFLLILGIIMVGIAVFRYQQVAHAAREGARYACVHGDQYHQETGNAAATDATIYANAIQPQIAGMHAANVTHAVSWNQSNKQTYTYVYTDPSTGATSVKARANTVTVTVSYSWDTGFFGVIPVSSTTVMNMSY